MKKPREFLQRFAARTDLPSVVVANLPQTTVSGFFELAIDLQKGLVSYSETEIIVAVSLGQISVCGNRLRIRLMKEGRIKIIGDIDKVEFHRSVL